MRVEHALIWMSLLALACNIYGLIGWWKLANARKKLKDYEIYAGTLAPESRNRPQADS